MKKRSVPNPERGFSLAPQYPLQLLSSLGELTVTRAIEKYLAGYPETLREQAVKLLDTGKIEAYLAQRYPNPPRVRNDRQLQALVTDLKGRYLKRAGNLSKICFCDKIATLHSALGLHSYVSRVQGAKLKAKNELRIASALKPAPPELLESVVIHELAHLKESEHNKAFYQLCLHMDPEYHQHELDLRLFLAWREV